jgi:thiamine biosynthesis lipoprotein
MDMQIVVTDPAALPTARRTADAELDAVDAAASRFRADSELVRLSMAGGRPTPVSPTLATLLEAALSAADLTDGDVDPTIGGALIALGYDADVSTLAEAPLPIDSPACPAVWTMVALHDRTVTVPPGITLDLGATAKAVAADLCAQRILERTGCGVLVNLGGDIATAGTAPPDGWQVEVRDCADDPVSRIALPSGGALATSSTLRRRWRRGNDLVHHILDPRTGAAANPVWRTVSVAAPTCEAANTLSTAAVIRGWSALRWLAELGMTARLVHHDRGVHLVGGWPENRPRAAR